MEVGPLARMVVGYAAGKKEILDAVDGALKALNAPPAVLFSTLGRIAARALEAQLMASQLEGWVERARSQSGSRQNGHLQSRSLGSGLVAEFRQRLRLARSAARLARPLGRDQR